MCFLQFYLSPGQFQLIRQILSELYNEKNHLFKQLFQQNQKVVYTGDLLNALLEIGLVSYNDSEWSANCSIYQLNDLFFVTDTFLLPETDRVFPLSDDESLFLASKIEVQPGDVVLDMGAGSGIYAIIAAQKAIRVVAIDINPKAISYAKFNAHLNGVAEKIIFIEGDLFREIPPDSCFDVIISNPAIIPTPPYSKFYTHSDGGLTGTDMSHCILENFNSYLSENGRLYMLATSFVVEQQKIIIQKIADIAGKDNYRFSIQTLYQQGLQNLGDLTDRFLGVACVEQLVNVIAQNNYTSLEYLLITAHRNNKFEIAESTLTNSFVKAEFSGDWSGRLGRLFRVYDLILAASDTQTPVNA